MKFCPQSLFLGLAVTCAMGLASGFATDAVAESVFSGSDLSGSTTNSDAAFDSWAASVASYSIDDFEGFNLTNFTTTAGNSFAAGPGDTLSDSDWQSGGVIDAPDYMVVGANSGGGGFAGSFTWTLAAPSDAFGFFAKDVEGSVASITVDFVGGDQAQYSMNPASTGSNNNLFWGISGVASQVSSVMVTSIDAGSLSSWDNFVISEAIPEPTTLTLATLALLGISYRRRKRA